MLRLFYGPRWVYILLLRNNTVIALHGLPCQEEREAVFYRLEGGLEKWSYMVGMLAFSGLY